MTRENVQQLLPPGRSLADCLGDCAVETGRNLGADYVVTGEVTAFAGQLRVTLSLHETARGNLIDSRRAGAPDLLGIETDLREKARELLLTLRISAAPAGGANGDEAPDTGPNRLPEAWTAQGATRVVVSFASEPAGAIVEIDGGQPVGGTPCKRSPGDRRLPRGLKKVRYLAHEQSLEVRAGAAAARVGGADARLVVG
ncbi:MAG: hypothetical protein IPK20_00510 [Betaproteobacteria bacterium]|nr:hypothetical protein [Betaproteobacteria bacterium]